MKKIIKTIIQVIVSLTMAGVCKHCGEITDMGFAYGILWCLITDIIFNIKIEYTVKDENGNETTKRIY